MINAGYVGGFPFLFSKRAAKITYATCGPPIQAFSEMPPVVDVFDLSLPLPDSVARELSPFHRLMRSHYIGIALFAVFVLATSFHPMFSIAPILLLITWLGVVDVRVMQRFFDYASGWFMAIAMVST